MKVNFILFISLLMILSGCGQRTRAGEGAIVGGAVGAGTGAAIGADSGNAGTGAIIGGATGAAVGGAVGSTIESGERPEDYDAMAEYQKKQIERQRQEMDDLRRQKLYDDKYRRYESQHSR